MNRYSPSYDYDEDKVDMGLDSEGDWVHINFCRKLEHELNEAYAEMSKQRCAITAIYDRNVWDRVKSWESK